MQTPNGMDLAPDLIHLNHAAVAPWPARTREAVSRFAAENASWGSKNYPQWLQLETQLREALATLINAPSADDIALLKSTSEALSVVAYGLDWQAGDNVVISNQEFPSNRIVWESLKNRGVEVIEVDLRGADTPAGAIIQATTPQTRLVAISSVQYASGLKTDLQQLGLHCKTHGILFCVDAIQSIGALQFDVRAIHADFVMADGHKWMLGPEGLALFYCHPEARDKLRLQQYGWHMVEHNGDFDRRDWQAAKSARRFECGSPNMLGIHALYASISFLLETGMDTVEQQLLTNTRRLFELISQSKNLQCLTGQSPHSYAGIVVLQHNHIDSPFLYQYLMQNNVLCALRGGGVRFSPHFYTPHSQLEHAVALADSFVHT